MTQPTSSASLPNDPHKETLFTQLMHLPRPYWMVNIMEMFERLAYYGVRVVIPIYIAQADEPGGLHFSQTEKGIIFAWWALVQSLVPMFTGGFADRYGYKKTIAFSVAIKVIGYLLMATQREFWPFLFGCLILALGTATFKPGVQGTMCQSLSTRNSSVGWGMFYMLVNVGGFLGPPLAHFLYGWSWAAVFYGCAVIVSLNFLMLFTYKEVPAGGDQSGGVWKIAKLTAKNLVQIKDDGILLTRLSIFVLIMSGFWLMFNQLFDMLPNFIVDWVDSSSLVRMLHLPNFMLDLNSDRAPQLSQEWMINFNSGLIILTVVLVSWWVNRMRRVTSITLGIIVGSLGLVFAGFTTSGVLCMLGILVFSVGEMLASPKMQDYLGVIAPEGQKGLYMGYANIPNAIGWFIGSYVAGTVYDKMGDKANLAIRYLADNHNVINVNRPVAFQKLQEITGLNPQDATNLLWNAYDPYELWYIFAIIGIVSAIAMVLFSVWVKKLEAPDV
ncbi:MAG: MFS transporter [candidate division Zixibacteria bacterium]|nr:MFS transporter [candidate division Zixibacteria bacterium]